MCQELKELKTKFSRENYPGFPNKSKWWVYYETWLMHMDHVSKRDLQIMILKVLLLFHRN